MTRFEEIMRDLLKSAQARGATAGDAVVVEGDSFDLQVRLGSIDKLTSAREKRLGLRLFFGHRSAVCSTSDFSRGSLDRLVEETSYLARSTAEDGFAGLPDPEPVMPLGFQLNDESLPQWAMEDRIKMATRAEAAALTYDPRIRNSEGAGLSFGDRRVGYVNTTGASGSYATSSVSLSVSPIAEDGGHMHRDYWYTVKRLVRELDSPDSVGRRAAQRALHRLGARRVKTCEVPVVLDPETAGDLLGSLSACVSGHSIYKGASFLAGQLGRAVAAPCVTVLDDGRMPGGLGSRPFDGEGLPTRKTTVVRDGVLENYLLDSYSGRKLGRPSTGNASRSVGDTPSVSPTNFYLAEGRSSPEEIIRSVKQGVYLTEMMGFGVNLVTGDYSRGAVGFWIENGERAYPIEEFTIAGNLKDMLLDIEMIGNDLEFRGSVASPTLKIGKMTVAGL